MTPAPDFLWRLAGQPAPTSKVHVVDTPEGAVCAVTGQPIKRGTDARTACGVSFDWAAARRRDSPWVSVPVAWALAGKPPATLRMWTIAATEHRTLPASHPKCAVTDLGPHVHFTNRADMRAVAALLTDPPVGEWLVTVAVSGHKHLAPYAATCTTGDPGDLDEPWTVRVEQVDVTSTPREMRHLLSHVAELRAAGFGPDTIAALDPGTRLSDRARLDAWRRHAAPLTAHRGSPLLALAASIPTKEHLNEYRATYPVADQDRAAV